MNDKRLVMPLRVRSEYRVYASTSLICKNFIIISIEKMGLVYSLTNYFYPTATPKLSHHAIRTKAQRLILYIKQAQFRLQK